MSMWKYVVGGQPLKRKETQTPEEKKIRDQEYESKHCKRLFQEGWKKDRPWFEWLWLMKYKLCSAITV